MGLDGKIGQRQRPLEGALHAGRERGRLAGDAAQVHQAIGGEAPVDDHGAAAAVADPRPAGLVEEQRPSLLVGQVDVVAAEEGRDAQAGAQGVLAAHRDRDQIDDRQRLVGGGDQRRRAARHRLVVPLIGLDVGEAPEARAVLRQPEPDQAGAQPGHIGERAGVQQFEQERVDHAPANCRNPRGLSPNSAANPIWPPWPPEIPNKRAHGAATHLAAERSGRFVGEFFVLLADRMAAWIGAGVPFAELALQRAGGRGTPGVFQWRRHHSERTPRLAVVSGRRGVSASGRPGAATTAGRRCPCARRPGRRSRVARRPGAGPATDTRRHRFEAPAHGVGHDLAGPLDQRAGGLALREGELAPAPGLAPALDREGPRNVREVGPLNPAAVGKIVGAPRHRGKRQRTVGRGEEPVPAGSRCFPGFPDSRRTSQRNHGGVSRVTHREKNK